MAATPDPQKAKVTVEMAGLAAAVQSEIMRLAAQYGIPMAVVEYAILSATADLDYRGLLQFYRDETYATDIAAIALQKAFTDPIAALDGATINSSLGKSDIASPSDYLAIVASYFREFEETVAESDEIAIGVQKSTSDAVAADEQIYNSLSKLFAESVSLSDTAFISFEDPESDSVVVEDVQPGDHPQIGFGKPASDSIATSDSPVLSLQKAEADSAPASDLISSIDASKAITDSQGVADSQVLEFSKITSDAAQTQDFAISQIDKPASDLLAVADNAYASVQKLLTESQTVADAVTTLFGTSFSDAQSLTDASVIGVTKNLSDLSSATEAGLLRMTDYADITYFAEDFIGTQTTF